MRGISRFFHDYRNCWWIRNIYILKFWAFLLKYKMKFYLSFFLIFFLLIFFFPTKKKKNMALKTNLLHFKTELLQNHLWQMSCLWKAKVKKNVPLQCEITSDSSFLTNDSELNRSYFENYFSLQREYDPVA